jgi:hypothetical protein
LTLLQCQWDCCTWIWNASDGVDLGNVGSSLQRPLPLRRRIPWRHNIGNLLDDYEEGTWTPTITFGGNSVGLTYTSNVGQYTKVGGLVSAYCYIDIGVKGSSTGAAYLEGLPFTSRSFGNGYCSATFWGVSLSTINYLEAYLGPNANKVLLQNLASDGSLADLTNSNFTDSTGIMINVQYRTDA